MLLFFDRHMAIPPSSPSPPPPPDLATPSLPSVLKKTRKATWLKSLANRPAGVERPMIHVDLVTRKANGPHKKGSHLGGYSGILIKCWMLLSYDLLKN